MTQKLYRRCKETDKWVKDIDNYIERLSGEFSPLNNIVYSGVNALDLLPIKFIQYNRTLLIWKRDSFPREAYLEIVRIFVFFVDDYYRNHQRGYKSFLSNIARLQTQTKQKELSPFLLDIIDSAYMFIMAGKYADRHKDMKIDSEALTILGERMQEAYDRFHIDPFEAIQASILNRIFIDFFGVDFELEVNDDQLSKLVLKRIGSISARATKSVGHTETYIEFLKLYNFVTPFVESSINDLHF